MDKGSPHSSVGKESVWDARDPDSIPGSGRSPGEGNGNPLQYSCLENPMNRGAWGHKELDTTEWLKREREMDKNKYPFASVTAITTILKTTFILGGRPSRVWYRGYHFKPGKRKTKTSLGEIENKQADGWKREGINLGCLTMLLLGFSVHGIFQSRIIEWVVISYSKRSFQPRDQTLVSCISCIGGQILYC